jgi:hypothetical protein
MNPITSADPIIPVPSPEYSTTKHPEPEFIDLTDVIEPGEPGYRDPDSDRLSGILAKINHLLLLTDMVPQEVMICR